ncbi:MAG: sigma-70 family RNA polymerase sigma factor [Acidimicrobiia bacterium]
MPAVRPRAAPSATAPVYVDFDDAFPELHAAAYRAGYRLLGNREAAADVAQEACARALDRWRSVGGQSYTVAWVVRVATNLAIGQWRKQQRRDKLDPRDLVHDAFRAEHPVGDRLDLHRALAKLSKRQREVVLLRYVADLPEAEVAAALGCSAGSVKTHASRGLAALRAELGDRTEP